jgi:predicted transcriptional regulator
MSESRPLGVLERAIMDHLRSVSERQTVRQIHAALTVQRPLTYVTVMTVLQTLVRKGLVVPNRDDRAHRSAAPGGCDDLIAELLVDALDVAGDPGRREAALTHFVERVSADEAATLLRALAELGTPLAVGKVVDAETP